jgi:hypothetical protein
MKMNRTAATEIEITARCRAFTGEGVREYRILVDSDEDIWVEDPVDGYFTRCHVLSAGQQARQQ